MNIEKVVNPVQPVFLRSDSTQSKETFQDIFKRALNNKSSSRPPKIELIGVLMPCSQTIQGCHYRFKLDCYSEEYLLDLSDALTLVAKKLEWDEVTVKGYLNIEDRIFEVEKMTLAHASSPPQKVTATPVESYFDIERYKRAIALQLNGWLEPEPGYLAS